jgi:hypothetical protein
MRVQPQGALAGRLQAYRGISLGQAHDAQASAVPHLRMRLAFEDDPHQFRSRRADVRGPVDQHLPLIELMNNAIVIVDLDKWKIGDMNAALIGSAILNHIGIYAFRRPAHHREDFTIMVDEFQNFSHGINWTTFFAELRKFGIRCWLATQSVTQVPEQWMDSILGNVNNLICFAVAYGDPTLSERLIWLDDHEFYAKVKIGRQRLLFEYVRAFQPIQKQGDESEYRDVLKTSRMRWGKNRKDVDAGILKLLRNGLKELA